jgi:hypothetical protein
MVVVNSQAHYSIVLMVRNSLFFATQIASSILLGEQCLINFQSDAVSILELGSKIDKLSFWRLLIFELLS